MRRRGVSGYVVCACLCFGRIGLPAGNVGRIDGVVLDEAGKPLEGVTVFAGALDPKVPETRKARWVAPGRFPLKLPGFIHEFGWETKTGPDGAFHLRGLKGPAFVLGAEKTDCIFPSPNDMLYPRGAKGVVIRAKPNSPRVLTGRVVDEHGRPVQDFTVNGQPFHDPQGRYRLTVRPSGGNAMQVVAREHLPELVTYTLTEAPEQPQQDVKLDPARSLRVLVLDAATGKPVEGATVLAREPLARKMPSVLRQMWSYLSFRLTGRPALTMKPSKFRPLMGFRLGRDSIRDQTDSSGVVSLDEVPEAEVVVVVCHGGGRCTEQTVREDQSDATVFIPATP